jgi:hypothetical protein
VLPDIGGVTDHVHGALRIAGRDEFGQLTGISKLPAAPS